MKITQAKKLLPALVIALSLLWSAAIASDLPLKPSLTFTILHTNDLHAHDDSYSDRGHIIGGMARIAHLMQFLRAHNPDVVTVDAGDIFQGTPYFNLYHGEVEVQMLNDAGYDIYTIGNHEFDDGPDNLAKQLQKAKFSVINCNLDASSCPALAAIIKPSVIEEIHGQKVAFVGAITPDLQHVTLHANGVKVINADGDWTAPIKQEVARLKNQGIDKIILVTHVGVELDRQLAQIPDVDVIVGGHSHTRLDKPIIVEHPDGSHCIIVQTGCYGRAIGKLDLAFDDQGKLDMPDTHYHLINITNRIHQDRQIARYLDEKSQPFQAIRKEIVATATRDFDNGFFRYPCDSPLGDLITDALAAGTQQYGATIALHNRGGIRGRIDKGPINEEKVEEVLPFDNTLYVATITGNELRKVLENSVGGRPAQPIMLGAKFLDVHGLKFEWDPNAPAGQRVKNIWAADKSGQLQPVDPTSDYRIAINSYSFAGGEGYDFSHAKDLKDTGEKLSVYLHDYLVKKKTITPVSDGRIVPLSPVSTVGQPKPATAAAR